MKARQAYTAAALVAAALGGGAGARADTLDAVRAAGVVRCGSNGAIEDYTRADTHGDVTDLADAVCKAVATAVLGPLGKATTHVWPDERHMLSSLRDGTSDLAIGVAPRPDIAAAFHVGFAPPVFYDGQGLLVRNDIGSAQGLAGQQVCFVGDGSLGEALRSEMSAKHIAYIPFPFEEVGEMLAAAGGTHCAAITGDVSQLANMRLGLASIEKRFHLLPDVFTSDPVAPVYRTDAPRWGRVVDAVVNALILADQAGVTADNVEQMQSSESVAVQALFGSGRAADKQLGLPDHWVQAVLHRVGNYGEIYARTLGADSDYGLPRGANRPVEQGGAMRAEPLR